MKKENYSFVILKDRLYCYHYLNKEWKLEPIQGEESTQIDSDDSFNWDSYLNKLNQRHNHDNKLKNVSITLIRSNETNFSYINNFPDSASKYNCSTWQLLISEELLQKKQIASLNKDTISQVLLPKTRLFESLGDITKENKEMIELRLELQKLEQQKETLLKDIRQTKEQKLREMETLPNTHDLITYLPLFFSDIWTKINMSDIACFAESLEIPEMPSPYQEPSNDCLHRLKHRFQQLPSPKQTAIIECCHDLQHQYKVRRSALYLLENDHAK